MDESTVDRALGFLQDRWRQDFSEAKRESWITVLTQCEDADVVRQILKDLGAYRKGRPDPGEFWDLYKAKLRRSSPGTTKIYEKPDDEYGPTCPMPAFVKEAIR